MRRDGEPTALGSLGPCDDLHINGEAGIPGQPGVRLRIWVQPPRGGRLMDAGFWSELWLGELVWVRFSFAFVAFNQAVFEAAEMRLARDPAQRLQGAVWLPLEPRRQQSGAMT